MSRPCLAMSTAFCIAVLVVPIVSHLFDDDGLTPHRRARIEREVAAFLETYQEPVPAAEPDRMARWFNDTPALEWYEDGERRYDSVAGMRKALESMPPTAVFTTTLEDPTIDPLAPGVCAVGSRFETRIDGLGSEVSYSGVVTMVLERGDGGWGIRCGHASSRK